MKTVGDEISSLEGVDRRVEELGERVSRLARQLAGVRVWHMDHAETETKLAVSDETFLISLRYILQHSILVNLIRCHMLL